MNYRIPASAIKVYNPEIYHCKKAKIKHVLDGNLDKEFWEGAEWTNDFQDIEGDAKPKPRYRTRTKMLWDDEAIYFGAELWGDEIWGNIKERDEVIFYDNDFEIFIDPDSDTHVYCEFEMNALNTIWDLLLTKPYRDGGKPINSLDIKGIKTAVKIYGELNKPDAKNIKWTAEILIPFYTILECVGQNGEKPKHGDFWRVNFSRVQWIVDVVDGKYVKRLDKDSNKPLPEDNWVWSPTGIVNMHYPELWGYVFFCEKEESFVIPNDEYLKWELRKMYYTQHKFYDETGTFTESIANNIHAKIQITDNCFEISCENSKKDGKISILTDGKFIYC